jgi:hypothetical protein
MPPLPKVRSPQTHIEKRIHKAILAQHADRQGEPRLRLSQIGECVRKLWAEVHGVVPPPEFPPRTLVLFELGNLIEEHVIELLRLAEFTVVSQQETVTMKLDDGRTVQGHIDGRVLLGRKHYERTEAVLEIKSANKDRFEELTQQGYEAWNPKYAAQLQAYMGACGLQHALAVIYCKDNSSIYAEKIAFDAKQYEALKHKAETVLGEKLPDRPTDATSQYCAHCKWCDAADWCWGPTAGVKFDD